jgi:hypothetical protein
MADVILKLIPMMLGTALAPIWIILVLLILQSSNGLVKAVAFVAGITTIRLLQGITFGAVFGIEKVAEEATSGLTPVVSILLIVVGILLLIAAIKMLCEEADPDAPPSKWLALIDSTSPLKVFGLGGLLTLVATKMWVFTLSAIGVIRQSDLSQAESMTTFLIYVGGAESLMILPLLIYAIAPRRSTTILRPATTWLKKYNRPITIAVSLIFGSLFLWKGISGLLL